MGCVDRVTAPAAGATGLHVRERRHGGERRRLSLIVRRHFLHCRYSDRSKQKPRVATTVCQLPAVVGPHVSLIVERACEADDHQPLMAFSGGLAVFPRRSQTGPAVSYLLNLGQVLDKAAVRLDHLHTNIRRVSRSHVRSPFRPQRRARIARRRRCPKSWPEPLTFFPERAVSRCRAITSTSPT